jgi:outer membrane protein OmpA-like peptidoglycan-associated protein
MLTAGAGALLATAQDEVPVRVDYLTLAQGALPVSIATTVRRTPGDDIALQTIDGNPGGFVVIGQAEPDSSVEFVFELPALTTFDRFAVPEVLETPSPSQTFSRRVEVYGSVDGADGDFELLASAELQTHPERDMTTDLEIVASTPVRWVKLRLSGGIELLSELMFYEFSEIIGNGSQEIVPLADTFTGIWRDRGVLIELQQDATTVAGCYDDDGVLTGTVSGNVLRATGTESNTGVGSLFILMVDAEGAVRGVRSSNGGPFHMYTGPVAPDGTETPCSEAPEPQLGCGSVIHGINFDFDSAALREDSGVVLEQLFEGLAADPEASITIEGHTSSEGNDDYNLALSQRRAQSVVDDLIGRGVASSRIQAVGVGEARPLASNDDEAGRALNRRVEVRCTEANG